MCTGRKVLHEEKSESGVSGEQLQKLQLVVATKGDGGGKKPQRNDDSPSEEEWPACMVAMVTEED